MAHDSDKPKRTRGSDGKLYNRKKVKDAGHRAHENRAQTAARRARWAGRRKLGWFQSGIISVFELLLTSLLVVFVRLPLAVARTITNISAAVGSRLGGWLGISRSKGRGRNRGRSR